MYFWFVIGDLVCFLSVLNDCRWIHAIFERTVNSMIRHAVFQERASSNTKYHCLYGYFFLGLSKAKLSTLYSKSPKTIASWIARYEQEGSVENPLPIAQIQRKFTSVMRQWLLNLYEREPVLYLDEARARFIKRFSISISASTIWTILSQSGLTWKVLERRAIQICYCDIIHYTEELLSIPWLLVNLVFLDEVSFDDRDMVRKHGYCKKGKHLVYRGEFNRKPRVSLLCFLGINGLLDTYMTDGTFTRLIFIQCLKNFARNTFVKQYPGIHSIWILDGAKIHCHPSIVYFLRSFGNSSYIFARVLSVLQPNWISIWAGQATIQENASGRKQRYTFDG